MEFGLKWVGPFLYRPIICLQTLGLGAQVTVPCNQFPTDLQTCCLGERLFQFIQPPLVCWLVRRTLGDIYTSLRNSIAHRSQLIYKLTSRCGRDCCEFRGLCARHHRGTKHKFYLMSCRCACSRAQTHTAVMIISTPPVLMTVTGGVVLRTTVLNCYYCPNTTETNDYIFQGREISIKILVIIPPHWEKNSI